MRCSALALVVIMIAGARAGAQTVVPAPVETARPEFYEFIEKIK